MGSFNLCATEIHKKLDLSALEEDVIIELTHRGRDKMDTIRQTKFSSVFFD